MTTQTTKTTQLTQVKHIISNSDGSVTLVCSAEIEEMKSNFDFMATMFMHDVRLYCKDFLSNNPLARKHIEDTNTILEYKDIPEYFVKMVSDNYYPSLLTKERLELFNRYCKFSRGFYYNDKTDYSSVQDLKGKTLFVHNDNLIGKYTEYTYVLSFSAFSALALYFYNKAVTSMRSEITERVKRYTEKWESNPLVQDLSWGGSGWVLNYNNFQEYIESCVWGHAFGHICITKEFGSKKATIDWNDDKDRPRFEISCSCFGADGYSASKRNVSLKTAMKFAEDEYVHYLAFVKRSEEKRDRIELAKEQMTALVPSDMVLKFSEHYKNEAYLSSNNVFILKFEYTTVNECYVRIGDSKKQMHFAQVIEFYNLNSKFFL